MASRRSRFPGWLRLLVTACVALLGYYLGRDRLIDPAPAPPTADRPRPTRPSTTRPAAGPDYGDPLAFGEPTLPDGRPGVLIRRPQYTLSYNPTLNVANWAAWTLNAGHFGDAPRTPGFYADPELPEGATKIVSSDYTGSGYDRGHLVRSEERTRSAADNRATFYMTNVLPQLHDLNGGPWLDLEMHCQRLAERDGKQLYLVAGGVFSKRPKRLKDKVAVPTHTWKVVLIFPSGAEPATVRAADIESIAVLMPNRTGISKEAWELHATSIDAVERATGLDLLPALPDGIESAIESRTGVPAGTR